MTFSILSPRIRLYMTAALCALLAAACGNPASGDGSGEGAGGGGGGNAASITLNLARAAGVQASYARAAYPPTDPILAQLSFTVSFSGGPAADKTITANPGTTTVRVSIEAGTWRIKTQAFLNGKLYAEGDETLNLKPGNNGTTVLMLRNAGMAGIIYQYHDGRPDTSEAVLQNTAATGPGTVTTSMTAPLTEGLYAVPVQPDVFGGWYRDSGYTIPWSFSTPVTDDIVLHAKWSPANTPVTLSGAGTIVEKTLSYVNGTNGNYVLFLENDISGFTGVTSANYTNTGGKLTLRADSPRTISLGVNGSIFRIGAGELEIENINLRGSPTNSDSLVYVDSGGAFILNSGTISGNTTSTSNGGGVAVWGGTFTMYGGTISGNTASMVDGGGVAVYGGIFTMYDGTISGNTAGAAGGVVVASSGIFTMNGGTISGNTGPSGFGGGVTIASSGIFTMNGGTISGNTAAAGGGGVAVLSSGIFTMHGGTISGNTSSSYGGGVAVDTAASFLKTAGTIYGSNAGPPNANTATPSGHAVYSGASSKYRNTTAGPGVSLDSSNFTNWNQ